MTTLASTVQAFFTDYLIRQRRASPHTIASYRDTFRLLFAFTARSSPAPARPRSRSPTSTPRWSARSSTSWKTSAATASAPATPGSPRSTRCSASPHCATSTMRPSSSASWPSRPRSDRKLVTYLTEPEAAALLAAPDTATRTGRRDTPADARHPGRAAGLRTHRPHLGRRIPGHRSPRHLHRKGPQKRITPLTPATAKVLGGWLGEHPGKPGDPLFPSRSGSPMSRDAVERRLTKHTTAAARTQPSLKGKKVSPHVLRHTAAMRLLAAGVDTTVIALWLGHETVATT